MGGNERKGSNPPNEDPDVWGPPPPKKKTKKRGNTSGHSKGKRDYEKPWQKSDKDKKKKGKKGEEDSPFLLHCYPDGKGGPDSELIKMLERDIVDRNPGISFDDIASLDNAK